MTNLLIHNYYYRAKSYKQLVKTLIQVDNNIEEAKNKLEVAIQEHDNYITARNISREENNFTIDDNLSLHHAKDHLVSFDSTGQQHQKSATIDALLEE